MKGPEVTIAEYGAAETVPGSKLLLCVDGKNILIDMGKDYSHETKMLPFNPKSIDAVVLTHGHLDHIGELMNLNRAFDGPIHATPETYDITEMQLKQDVGSVYMYNKSIRGKRIQFGPKKGEYVPFKKAEYTTDDVNKTMAQVLQHDYHEQFQLPNATATFYDAGHIPGSAQILFTIDTKEGPKKLLTSFDLGRTDYKILGHPVADIPLVRYPETEFPGDIDYIVIESTYGNRVHGPLEESISTLEKAVQDTYDQKGRLIIPAFSIMRTHMLWNFLYRLHEEGRLPEMPIYSSSPTANTVSRIILKHIKDLDERALEEFERKNNNPFEFPGLIHHKKMAETYEVLDNAQPPYAIIASSGMCEMGRVVPILAKTISNPTTMVLLTGYASPGTRADALKRGAKEIYFDGEMIENNAEVRKMGGLSGHADKDEIIAHLKHIHPPGQGKQFKGIFIKHGEKEACYALRDSIIEAGYAPETVIVMKKGVKYEI
ncbi:MAG: MBL fold metallo-hydrolase [archaeon]